MNRTRSKLIENRDYSDSGRLISQLEREISCLERQLGRLKMLNGNMDRRTLCTYEDMISSRKQMLAELY